MNSSRKILIYDTTLRDGLQRHGVSCSLKDRIKIVEKLAEFGIPFIEAGWPGSNPVDNQVFKHFAKEPLAAANIVAFGSTRRPKQRAEDDKILRALVDAGTLWVTIFGKSWDLHVRDALRVDLNENISMIQDTIEFLRAHGKRVIYDAEHWFDGYKANRDYALETIRSALSFGVEWLVLCDTNGAMLPDEVKSITHETKLWLMSQESRFSLPCLGIHTHNDIGTAVASTMAAVDSGANMIQGTINGYGERCGNADLCTLIPNLKLKKGYDYVNPIRLEELTGISYFISETINLAPNDHAPYVGRSAFTHKGGIHISAVKRNSKTYEHTIPSIVGNSQKIIISSSSGVTAILTKARDYGINLDRNDPSVIKILEKIKYLESTGYQFEAAEASFELLILKEFGNFPSLFELKGFKVSYDMLQDKTPRYTSAQATIKVSVDGDNVLEVAECLGPVSALDKALRKALSRFYPVIDTFYLTDYKVRILDSNAGTKANIRVLVESSNGLSRWSTIGVSVNILEASYDAVVSGIEYGLFRHSSL